MSGEQIVTLCVGLANAALAILTVVLSYVLFNKKEKIYLKRQDAIYRALALCDKYLSWLNYYTGQTKDPDPTRNLDDSTLSITEEARFVYHTLIMFYRINTRTKDNEIWKVSILAIEQSDLLCSWL